jgi:UDP-N-acetylglucosamine 2-epimerase (non-hydrolysing)
MKQKKLGFIFGTRPEIIKLSPLIKECKKRRVPFFCIHTGQHYSYEMDKVFFKDLDLPMPEYRLQIRSTAPWRQGEHTGQMLISIEEILLKENPYAVVVQGDTNTVLAGALTAEKISTTGAYTGFHIKVAHVEAGLRSYDRTMPEETNRFITDHLSDFLFAPTEHAKKILLGEGVPSKWIYVTGNSIADVVYTYKDTAAKKSTILKSLNLEDQPYILLTIHRQENVDNRDVFSNILTGIGKIRAALKLPIVFPMHPRSVKMLAKYKLKIPLGVRTIPPVGFLDFLALEARARLALTDSGGVQEECCILKVPCVTLRDNTERPETVEVGANCVAGTSPQRILSASVKMIKSKRQWKNPLGNGTAAKKMIDILMK